MIKGVCATIQPKIPEKKRKEKSLEQTARTFTQPHDRMNVTNVLSRKQVEPVNKSVFVGDLRRFMSRVKARGRVCVCGHVQ